MQRYFFHVRDGKTFLDETGFECASREQMRAEALRAAGEILTELGSHFWTDPEWTMWVVDQSGATVLTLDFSAKEPEVTDAA